MEFSKSAGVFLSGIILILCGSALSVFFGFVVGVALAHGSDPQLFMIVAFCGFGLVLLGVIQLIVALYRALVKIDALPVHEPYPADRAEWIR